MKEFFKRLFDIASMKQELFLLKKKNKNLEKYNKELNLIHVHQRTVIGKLTLKNDELMKQLNEIPQFGN